MSKGGTFRHRQLLVATSSIHVIEAGHEDGPAFLFLHGWPQSWRSWKSVMRLAAFEHRAVALDLPGIGGSRGLVGDGSKSELAWLVHILIERLGLGDVTLVGHDVGGMIAYAYLRRYDDMAGVVVMDTVIPGVNPWNEVIRNPRIWHFAFHALAGLPELLVQGRQAAYFNYFFDALSVDPTKPTRKARAEYAAAYRSAESLTAGFDLYRAFPNDAADNMAFGKGPSVATPLLYVRGDGEAGEIDTYAGGLRESGVGNLTTATVHNAGHFTPEEQPAEVWQIIGGFAGTVMAGSRAMPEVRDAE